MDRMRIIDKGLNVLQLSLSETRSTEPWNRNSIGANILHKITITLHILPLEVQYLKCFEFVQARACKRQSLMPDFLSFHWLNQKSITARSKLRPDGFVFQISLSWTTDRIAIMYFVMKFNFCSLLYSGSMIILRELSFVRL